MFKFLNSLFGAKDKKDSVGNLAEEEQVETRKCKRCLRRYDIDKPRCPYCRSEEFTE